MIYFQLVRMVPRGGIEPPTLRFSVACLVKVFKHLKQQRMSTLILPPMVYVEIVNNTFALSHPTLSL